jgi:CarD family transcriptional regulator
VEHRELLDGRKQYYVIEIPEHQLTVYLPIQKADQVGVRPAMSQARLPRVLARLVSKPRRLPQDFRERQEETSEKLSTGRVMQIAEIVRDLAWHKQQEHLTRRDSDLLVQATKRLAAEMALVSGDEVDDVEKTISDTVAAAVTSRATQGRHSPEHTHMIELRAISPRSS